MTIYRRFAASPFTPLAFFAPLALFLLHCAEPSAPLPARPSPPLPASAASAIPSASPAPPALAVSSVASAEPAPLPPQEPIDPAADREALALVQAICPAAIKHDKDDKVLVGCRACPPFEGDSGKPDGRVAIDPDTFFPVEAIHHGAFSKPNADEVAAVFEGCEPHAANYGGTLFAERTAAGYRTITYASGVHPAFCQVYRRTDARDVLVCQWSDAHQSTAFTQVFVYDLTRATKDDPIQGWTSLVTIENNAYSVCWGVSPETGVMQGKVLGFRFEDRNGDKVRDVVVEATHRRTPYSTAMDKTIQAKCAVEAAKKSDDGPSIDVARLLGAPTKHTLEFLASGPGFKASPKTEAALKRM